MTCRNSQRGSVKKQRLSEAAFRFGYTREPLQFLRVDDGKIEASLRAVIQEDGIDDFPSSRGETERNVRDTEDSFDIRVLLFDESDGLDRLPCPADVVFVAGGAG